MLVDRGCREEALAEMKSAPLLKELLWPEAETAFLNANRVKDLFLVRISIALEIRISLLAMTQIELEQDYPNGEQFADWSKLLPGSNERTGNPLAMFYKMLAREAGQSINGMLNDSRLQHLSLDESTLKRWSSGKCIPNVEVLDDICHSLFGEHQAKLLRWTAYASRVLNFLGYLSQSIIALVMTVPDEKQYLFSPWPALPFGYDTFEEWVRARYRHWLGEHRQ